MIFDPQKINPLCHLFDCVTVHRAAALIAGFDPSSVRYRSDDDIWFASETGLTSSDGVNWVLTAFAALRNAVIQGSIKATIRHVAWERGCDEVPNDNESLRYYTDDLGIPTGVVFKKDPDWSRTTISVEDLRAWLKKSGIKSGFFFPGASDVPSYLDQNHPRYAPKLAAAIRVWEAVEDPGPKTPKQALEKWLRENAADFGLTKEDGRANELGITEVAKVANWKPDGGSPKTPGNNLPTPKSRVE